MSKSSSDSVSRFGVPFDSGNGVLPPSVEGERETLIVSPPPPPLCCVRCLRCFRRLPAEAQTATTR